MSALRYSLFFLYTALQGSQSLEEALSNLSESIEGITWNISPITCLESWTIGDIDPQKRTALKTLNPTPSDHSALLLQPYSRFNLDFIESSYQKRTRTIPVLAQKPGTLCGVHAIKNSCIITSAVTAESAHEARRLIQKLWALDIFEEFKEKLGEIVENPTICALSMADFNVFKWRVAHDATNPVPQVLSETGYPFIQKSYFVYLNHYGEYTEQFRPFKSHPAQEDFVEWQKNMTTGIGVLVRPLIVLTTVSAETSALAGHIFSITALNDTAHQHALCIVADSLKTSHLIGANLSIEYLTQRMVGVARRKP